MDTTKMKEALDGIINGFLRFKAALQDQPPPQTEIARVDNDLDGFDKLKKALESNRWPDAVSRNLICDPDSEVDKTERGRGIVELLVEENLSGLKFLDFGCGEGHSTLHASEENAAISIGYDIKEFTSWATFPPRDNLLFTKDFSVIEQNAPYDVILIFDVLDHVVKDDPVAVLKKAGSVLSDNGKIYCRCHPYVSRHATHLYQDVFLNKAFVHLVFTDEELAQLAPNNKYYEHNIGVRYPILTVESWVKDGGLKLLSRREVKEAVEAFFRIPKVCSRIMSKLKVDSFPEFQMSISFIDLCIGKI